MDTAVSLPGRGLYVFSGDQVWRYTDPRRRVPDFGYPKPITAEFPGAFQRDLDAALVHPDGALYLFRGNQHLRYNLTTGRPELGYPRPYAPDWPGVFPDRIDTAITWAPDIIYLFCGDTYTSFSPRQHRARSGFPKPIRGNWPGISRGPVTSAFTLPGDRTVLLADAPYLVDTDGYPRTIPPTDLPELPPTARFERRQVPRAVDLENPVAKATVPIWAQSIGPFPKAPKLDFTTTDTKMASAFATVTGNNPTNLCVALVDLTGSPAKPPYAGLNDRDMLYPGSMMKIGALYAAFALKKQVQAIVSAAGANGASTAAADILPIIDAAWRPKLKALYPGRPEKPYKLKDNVVVPQLGKIFDVVLDFATGKVQKVQFKSDPMISDKDIDLPPCPNSHRELAGEYAAHGMFAEWMRSMCRWSSDPAASKVVDALGYFYINGALADAGFFAASSAADGNGLWLSADYEGNDWVTTVKEKKANAAGPKLTKRWANTQLDEGRPRVRSNITATAFQTARLMTLMATDQLVDRDSSQKMRTLLGSSITHITSTNCHGIGSYIKAALHGAHRAFDTLQSKIGYGNDCFSHDCGIIERTVGGKKLKYVIVVLGSAPTTGCPDRSLHIPADFSTMVRRLDDAIIARNP